MSDRNRRKTLVGIVTSNKMDKSIVVSIEETPFTVNPRRSPRSSWRTTKTTSARSAIK